jgi:hypothetical protein
MNIEDKLKKLEKIEPVTIDLPKDVKESIAAEAKSIDKYTKQRAKEVADIKESIEALGKAHNINVSLPEIDPLLKKLQTLENLPDTFGDIKTLAKEINTSLGKEVKISGFREIWELVVRQNNKIDKANKEIADRTIEKFADLRQYIDSLTETLKQGQEPGDYKPVRIVIGGDGTKLDFLKSMPNVRGGGGSGGSSSGGLTDAELRASPVPVEATIDTSGLATTLTDTNTTAIKTAVETIDNAISGSEMQVDVVAALPAGNNNIGDVDVASSALPTGASTAAKQDTMIGHLDGVEGLLTEIEADTDTLAVVGGGTEAAAQRVTIANDSTGVLSIDDNGDSLTVDGTVAVTNAGLTELAGAIDTEVQVDVVGALPAGTNNIGDVDIASIAAGDNNIGNVDIASSALPSGASTSAKQDTAQTALDAIKTSVETIDNTVSGNELQVDVLTMPTVTVNSHAVTNAGTFAVQVDGSALTALQLIDDPVFADDAAYTLGTNKGNVAGGIAVQTDGTDPTAVSAEGDVAALRTDMQRNLIVNQTHPRFWHVSADYASAQTNTSVKATPGSSLSLYITDLQISNGATAGNVTLLNGSGGTVLYELYPAINGGATLSLRSPIKLSADTALCITSTTVTTHSIFVSGYIAP